MGKAKKYCCVGMGAALVDVFADISEADLARLGSPKSSMSLITPKEAEALEAAVSLHTRASGGSAGNTIAGIAALGLPTGFIGKVGNDELGRFFADDMAAVQTAFATQPHDALPTGRCIVLITPDAERTMHTLLGASVATDSSDLDTAMLAETDILFGEGYIWDSETAHRAFLEAASIVRAHGGRVALSLSDPFCVQRHHGRFEEALESHIDIVLANQAEAEAMFGGTRAQQWATAARGLGLEAVVTRGADGAVVISADETIAIAAETVTDITDLTGAGDQFAAGYLSGRAMNKSLEESARRGALAAAEVIGHVGPRPQNDVGERFKLAGLS